MIRNLSLLSAAFVFFAGESWAACPSQGPSERNVQMASGDQRINAAWLQKTLGGMKLRFKAGTEYYMSNGEYRYTESNGNKYEASGYRFYDTGFRCIDYPNNPRFDFYVVNDGKLVLIDGQGYRFVGQLTR